MIPALIACLTGGVLFAALAVYLHRSPGNTLRDILTSPSFQGGAPDSLRLELDRVEKKLRLSTQMPIVALYLIAALVAVAVPIMIVHKGEAGKCGESTMAETITISGRVRKAGGDMVFLRPRNLTIDPSGFFEIPLNAREGRLGYTLESEYYLPLTLYMEYSRQSNQLILDITDHSQVLRDTLSVHPERRSASLKEPIELVSARRAAAEGVVNEVTAAPSTAADRGEAARPSDMISLEDIR